MFSFRLLVRYEPGQPNVLLQEYSNFNSSKLLTNNYSI